MDTLDQVEKHSPLPWRLEHMVRPDKAIDWMIVDATDASVTHSAEYDDMAPTYADMKLIVEAVNEHTELIAALKEFLGSAVEFDDQRMGYVTMQVDRNLIEATRTLLDKVNKQ